MAVGQEHDSLPAGPQPFDEIVRLLPRDLVAVEHPLELLPELLGISSGGSVGLRRRNIGERRVECCLRVDGHRRRVCAGRHERGRKPVRRHFNENRQRRLPGRRRMTLHPVHEYPRFPVRTEVRNARRFDEMTQHTITPAVRMPCWLTDHGPPSDDRTPAGLPGFGFSTFSAVRDDRVSRRAFAAFRFKNSSAFNVFRRTDHRHDRP